MEKKRLVDQQKMTILDSGEDRTIRKKCMSTKIFKAPIWRNEPLDKLSLNFLKKLRNMVMEKMEGKAKKTDD
jgi:hypothetical protein